jgi:hypothetical protein
VLGSWNASLRSYLKPGTSGYEPGKYTLVGPSFWNDRHLKISMSFSELEVLTKNAMDIHVKVTHRLHNDDAEAIKVSESSGYYNHTDSKSKS